MLKARSNLQGITLHLELDFCDTCANAIRKVLDGKSRREDLHLEATAQIVSCSQCGCFDVMPDDELQRVGAMLSGMIERNRKGRPGGSMEN